MGLVGKHYLIFFHFLFLFFVLFSNTRPIFNAWGHAMLFEAALILDRAKWHHSIALDGEKSWRNTFN